MATTVADAWRCLFVVIGVSQMGAAVFVKKYFQDTYLGGDQYRYPMKGIEEYMNGDDQVLQNSVKRQWGEEGNIMSFNYFMDFGCPVLNQCYQNYFSDIGFTGESGSGEDWDMEMCINANHNLYECFQSAFEGTDMCHCATWQVEEAAQYIHGHETDYSRHMNMHCQGYHDFFEQNQQCHPRKECAAKLEYLTWNDLRFKCGRRQDIEDVRECFEELHRGGPDMRMDSCPYLRWFYHMSHDHHIQHLFRMFELEIQGCPVNQIMYSCGHDYDRMGPSAMCAMRHHYMSEYTHCMTRMMEATPDCQRGMRDIRSASMELMHVFMEDQCQMNQDVHLKMSHCCSNNNNKRYMNWWGGANEKQTANMYGGWGSGAQNAQDFEADGRFLDGYWKHAGTAIDSTPEQKYYDWLNQSSKKDSTIAEAGLNEADVEDAVTKTHLKEALSKSQLNQLKDAVVQSQLHPYTHEV